MKLAIILFKASLCLGLLSLAPLLRAADWTIVPGIRVGAITKDSSENDLKKLYGDKNVVQSDIYVGEGLTLPGTLLFPDDPTKKLAILWTNESRDRPNDVLISDEGSVWITENGITIGTSLRAIERLNKRSVTLTGFGWDYSGTIFHCNGGSLKELGVETESGIQGRTLTIRVSPDSKLRETPEYRVTVGDRAFKSDHPAMTKLDPRVYQMIVSLR